MKKTTIDTRNALESPTRVRMTQKGIDVREPGLATLANVPFCGVLKLTIDQRARRRVMRSSVMTLLDNANYQPCVSNVKPKRTRRDGNVQTILGA